MTDERYDRSNQRERSRRDSEAIAMQSDSLAL
jgi:hypothetical protein